MEAKLGERSFRLLTLLLSLLLFSCVTSEVESMSKDVDSEKTVDENIWIFLMAGQSNMAGRGAIEAQDIITNERILSINQENEWIRAREPLHFYEPSAAGLDCGMSFAREMLKNVPDSVTIAMVPCAVGGSSVFQWLNDEEHRGVRLLSNFREMVSLSGKNGLIKGILWHQGEGNANTQDLLEYEEALLELFSNFRTIIQNDTLPIVLGEIGSFAEPEEKAGYFDGINLIISKVAEENDNIYYILSEGLDHKGDHLHFNSEAQRELGKRYAREMVSILILE